MPSFAATKQNSALLRCLGFGFAKTKKTWWAGTAAEAGFNVIHLSAEKNGHAIFSRLSEQAQSRIFVLDISDDFSRYTCAEFLALFLGGRAFYWNEETKRHSWSPQEGMLYIDPTRLTRDVVLTLDPWTNVVSSLVAQYCAENNINMSDASKPDWSHYRWCGAFASWMITQLISLPCHFNLLAHSTMYEKRREEAGKTVIEWARKQVFSSSGPHAMTMPGKFDEVLHFDMSGKNHFIESQSRDDADGGGRFTPPSRYKWEALPYSVLAKIAGLVPSEDLPPVTAYFPPVSEEQLAQAAARTHGLLNPAKPVDGTVQQPAAKAGLLLGVRK